ncbi:M17 family peptidase N-terminal domain-containing protein, partial [Nostocoides japonicum]|uniref:M17 family peptidase N-terminal domain-containing protein n=1 Tax=Nostocoides japonicum TaxID=99481 RepID=UPI002E0E9ED0
MPTLRSTTRDAHTISADALVLGLAAGPDGPTVAREGLPKETVRHLADAVDVLGLTGKAGEVTRLVGVPGVRPRSVVLTGLGDPPAAGPASDPEVLRRAAGAALRAVGKTAS